MEEQRNTENVCMEQTAETENIEIANEPAETNATETTEQNNNENNSTKKWLDKKSLTGIAIAVIAVIIIICSVSKNPYREIVKAIEKEDMGQAQKIYNEISDQMKSKVDDEIEETCMDLIEEYNTEEKTYEEASDMISSFCDITSVASEYSSELSQLHNSKTAFAKALDFAENKEWSSAIEEYKKVIETDDNYDTAVTEIENCQKQLSLEHYKKAKEHQEKEEWASAIDEYSQVTKITSTEYETAQKEVKTCVEKIKSTLYSDLDTLFKEEKYEEGLQLIEKTEKYIDEEELKTKKQEFTQKKEEADRMKEAQKYETGITYDQLNRNPDEYEGQYVKFQGKVLQVQSSSYMTVYRIGTAGYGYYDNVIYATQWGSNDKNRIVEDDIVTVKGMSTGLYTYEAVMGNSITIPSISVDSIER